MWHFQVDYGVLHQARAVPVQQGLRRGVQEDGGADREGDGEAEDGREFGVGLRGVCFEIELSGERC